MTLIAATTFAVSPAGAAPAPAKPIPPEARDDTITVTGAKAGSVSAIDRKIYTVGRDLQSVTGSVADVLDKLPSVDIDASGNVSLRGDANVQILVDGKPSAGTNATNRGEYLQQIPADSVESIEVITNPSARYKPDGATGIINIVTKKNRKPGRSGSARASVGSDGRFNLSASPGYHAGKLTLNSNISLKRDVPFRPFTDLRTQVDSATGVRTDSAQNGYVTSRRLSYIGSLSADYDLKKTDRLSASLTVNQRDGDLRFVEANRSVSGGVITDFDRVGTGPEHETITDADVKYRHSFSGKDHELTLDLRYGEEAENQLRQFINNFRSPPGLVTGDYEAPSDDMIERELTLEYARPLNDGAKLLLGYDLQRNDDEFDNRGGFRDNATGIYIADPTQTTRFVYGQTVHAAYTTYERSFGKKLTALFGLRYEATFIETNQVTTRQLNYSRYFRVYPTLHLEFTASDASTLRASYSHRIVRPDPEQLNPYPLFQNPLNIRAGNPFLRPQETDSFETTYAYAKHGISIELTPYVRNTTNLFSTVSRLVSPTLLLTSVANLGTSLAAGVEAIASGKISSVLSVNASTNLFYNRIEASNLGLPGKRSLISYTAKGSVDWKVTPRDTFQVSTSYVGERLTPQGRRRPTVSTNLGFSHQLRPGLAAVATITDLFDSAFDRVVLDIGSLHDYQTLRRGVRAGNVALSWTFGAKKPAAAKFDYSE